MTGAPAAGLGEVRYNAEGLVPAVVQEAGTREVLMLAWMDAEALRRTLDSGRTWFWSRSRQQYWQKGETSGDRQLVRGVSVDCDGDTLLVEVDQEGRGACHTGQRSCFYRALQAAEPTDAGDAGLAAAAGLTGAGAGERAGGASGEGAGDAGS